MVTSSTKFLKLDDISPFRQTDLDSTSIGARHQHHVTMETLQQRGGGVRYDTKGTTITGETQYTRTQGQHGQRIHWFQFQYSLAMLQ